MPFSILTHAFLLLHSTAGAIELDWGGGKVCSAALIAPTRAVTAAHCVLDTLPVARQGGRAVAVTAMAAHPDWRKRSVHDVAIVALAAPLADPYALPAAPRPLGADALLSYRGFGAEHGGRPALAVAVTGTRQRWDVATPTSTLAVGDSGGPVVRIDRPRELVGVMTAILPGAEGGITTTFDAGDLAFLRAFVP